MMADRAELNRETLVTLKTHGFGDGSIGRSYGMTNYEVRKLRKLWNISPTSSRAASSHVLKYLRTAPADVTNAKISEDIGLTLSEVSKILSYLEKRGSIIRFLNHSSPGRSSRKIVVVSDKDGVEKRDGNRWGWGDLSVVEMAKLYGNSVYGVEISRPLKLSSGEIYRFFTGRERPEQ